MAVEGAWLVPESPRIPQHGSHRSLAAWQIHNLRSGPAGVSICAGVAASAGIYSPNVTTRITQIVNSPMSAMMGMAINKEGSWVLCCRRIDGVCPDRPANGIACRPGIEPACNPGPFMKKMRLPSGNCKPIVAEGAKGFHEQLLGFAKSNSARIHYRFRSKPWKVCQSSRQQ